MKKKYNNESKFFKKWTTEKLKEEAQAYHGMIYVSDCYGCKDLMAYDGIMNELGKRDVKSFTALRFSK